MGIVSQEFEQNGGSYLLSDKNYEQHVEGQNKIGRPDGQFMTPSNQMDDLLQNHPNDPREWEKQLGLGENSLGDENIHRVDVYRPQDYEPRMPTSDLSGANEKFLEGRGKTPGGQDECVINPFPNPEQHPEIGQITTLNTPSINATPEQGDSDSRVSSANIESIAGGGARAPNENTKPCGTVDANTSNGFFDAKIKSTEQTPTPATSKSATTGVNYGM